MDLPGTKKQTQPGLAGYLKIQASGALPEMENKIKSKIRSWRAHAIAWDSDCIKGECDACNLLRGASHGHLIVPKYRAEILKKCVNRMEQMSFFNN